MEYALGLFCGFVAAFLGWPAFGDYPSSLSPTRFLAGVIRPRGVSYLIALIAWTAITGTLFSDTFFLGALHGMAFMAWALGTGSIQDNY